MLQPDEDDESQYSGVLGPMPDVLRASWGPVPRHHIPAPPLDGIVDIYGVACQAMGLKLNLIDMTKTPHILGLFLPEGHEIILDRTAAPPLGPTKTTTDIRSMVNRSYTARLALAWFALMASQPQADSAPACISFTPEHRLYHNQTEDEYRERFRLLCQLVAPQSLLLSQLTYHGIQVQPRQPWRDAVRQQFPAGLDDAIGILSMMNRCPPLLVECSLDGVGEAPPSATLSDILCLENPYLSLKRKRSLRYFQERGEFPRTVPSHRMMPAELRRELEMRVVLVL